MLGGLIFWKLSGISDGQGDPALLGLRTSFPTTAYQASGGSYVVRELENLLPRIWPSVVEQGRRLVPSSLPQFSSYSAAGEKDAGAIILVQGFA